MKTENGQCFLCGLPSEFGQEKRCGEEFEGDSSIQESVEPIATASKLTNPFNFLLESVLRIPIDGNDTKSNENQNQTNLCLKCSKDATYLFELQEEMKRLELISKTKSEELINSMMMSLVQFSRGSNMKANIILEDAVQNLRRTPVQFKIYRRWRSRFVKLFNTVHGDAETLTLHSVEDMEPIVQTKSEDNKFMGLSTLERLMGEKHATLMHDHSYGLSLKSDIVGSSAGNNETNLINPAMAEDKVVEHFYVCTVCDRKFRRKATLNEHIKRGHKHSEVCSKRNSRCPTQEVFGQHFFDLYHADKNPCPTCSGSSESGLKCNACSISGPKNTKVNAEMQTNQERKDTCSTDEDDAGVDADWMLPPSKSNFMEALADRVNPAMLKSNEPIKCHVCAQTFNKRMDLRLHLRTHTGERPFVCDYCKKSFLDKRQLTIHLRIHTGEKPYICELCGTCFSSLAGFHSHRKTHAKFRPYKCEQCDGNFRSAGQLRKHLLIHSGEKPFSCTICQKSFNRKENLRIHEYTHSTFKPHKCPQCPQSYVRASYLKNHITECHSSSNSNEVDDNADSLTGLTNYVSAKTIIADLPEDQVKIFAYDPNQSVHPHFVTAPSSTGPGGLSFIPEALFVANNGEQYIIFN